MCAGEAPDEKLKINNWGLRLNFLCSDCFLLKLVALSNMVAIEEVCDTSFIHKNIPVTYVYCKQKQNVKSNYKAVVGLGMTSLPRISFLVLIHIAGKCVHAGVQVKSVKLLMCSINDIII